MTVLDEVKCMSKYTYLTFVEFLDMLSRLAIVAINTVQTIDYKAHALLQIIYNKMYADEEFNKRDHPLYLPCDELRR